MANDDRPLSRRTFLKRTTALAAGAIGARGVYALLDGLGGPPLAHVATAASPPRRDEQYIVEDLETITDNGVTLIVPPRYTDVITANLARGRSWSTAALQDAQARLEQALRQVEGSKTPTASGLTIVVGWGLSFFRHYLPAALWQETLPQDLELSQLLNARQYAVLDAIRFASDPSDLVLEQNDVAFKFRSDSQATLAEAERALFEDQRSPAYVGDLFDLTSKRIGFLGRGFGTPSVAKQLALAAGVAGATAIPENAQLLLGFTSTQQAALGPDRIPSFETLPGITNQSRQSYFAAGCAMHLSHLFLDLELWYNRFNGTAGPRPYQDRVARLFSPGTAERLSRTTQPVTLPNGPSEVANVADVEADAQRGLLGHNATLQTATRLGADVVDTYGQLRRKGTPVPLREDFNTLDNPFAQYRDARGQWTTPTPNTPGMHFVVFVPSSHRFHRARHAMDGLMPGPKGSTINLRTTYGLTDAHIGINAMMRASHRQNFLVPPRKHRSFPLVERLASSSTQPSIPPQTATPTQTSPPVPPRSPEPTPTHTPPHTPTRTPGDDAAGDDHVFLPFVRR